MNIHRWLKWGARRGYLAAVPFSWADEDLRLPKKGTARSQLLSVDAERALRQPGVMSDFLTAAVDVSLATGLRKNTLRLLQHEDIRWDRGAHGELHIPALKMKGRNASVKELTPASARALKSRMEFYLARGVLKPQTFLFGKEDGTELNERAFPINKHWGRAKRKAKLPTSGAESVTFHDLRATAACRLYRRMGRIDVVMRFLDHTSLEMTQNYLRAHLGELEEVANVMSAVEAETQAALAGRAGATTGATVVPMKGRKSR